MKFFFKIKSFLNLIKAVMKTANFIVSFKVIFNIKAFGSKGMNRKKF